MACIELFYLFISLVGAELTEIHSWRNLDMASDIELKATNSRLRFKTSGGHQKICLNADAQCYYEEIRGYVYPEVRKGTLAENMVYTLYSAGRQADSVDPADFIIYQRISDHS